MSTAIDPAVDVPTTWAEAASHKKQRDEPGICSGIGFKTITEERGGLSQEEVCRWVGTIYEDFEQTDQDARIRGWDMRKATADAVRLSGSMIIRDNKEEPEMDLAID
ncbi:MAG: hypothetical protein ALECFALPRED_006139 [Alectoria fallacina]|uniref:Uncharacterized protein n=1 Tax=Alectoria fallacina TaxID=1903189 RepID=A0A8H3IBG4_9LECA|nr:MAG: hypothetical protein ALECFALPRED_006139 [Alectoria fallacina]